MRDRCEKLVSFSLNLTCTSLQDTVLEKKCLVFLLITNSIKIFGRDAQPLQKNSFSLNFTYHSLQGTVLEKKCLVFLLITNSIKIFGRDAQPL